MVCSASASSLSPLSALLRGFCTGGYFDTREFAVSALWLALVGTAAVVILVVVALSAGPVARWRELSR